MKYTTLIRFGNNIAYWAFTQMCPPTGYMQYYGVAKFVFNILHSLNHIEFTAMVYYYSTRADSRFKSSCICALASFCNFSHAIFDSFYFSILDHFEYNHVAIAVFLIVTICQIFVTPNLYAKYDSMSEESFRVDNNKKKIK